jgi:hypothetical protein
MLILPPDFRNSIVRGPINYILIDHQNLRIEYE